MLTKQENKLFYKNVFALLIPMALQNLINVAVQSADVIMLGKYNEVMLSAVSLAGQVQFVMILFFFGLTSGACVLAAQYWGKNDTRTIEKVMAITFKMAFVVGIIFFLAASIIPENLMRIFSKEEDVIAYGASYLKIVAPSYLILAFTNIYLNIMRSIEKVLVSTFTYLAAFVLNVILNAILIFGLLGFPEMGIQGAALATLLARCLELIIVIVYAVKNPILRLRKEDYLPKPKSERRKFKENLLFNDFMKYTIPTALNELFWGMAISANSMIIGRLGAQAVAANGVAQVVRQLATVICFGLANATAIIVGKVIGSGDMKKAKVYASKFIKLTIITSLFGSALILIIRPFVVKGMGLTPQASEYLSFFLLVMSVYVIGQAFNTTAIVGVFRAGGDTRFAMFLDFAVMWFGSILWGALAAFVFKAPVQIVYMIIMSDEIIKIPICIWRYKSKRWLKNITRDEY